MTVAETTAEAMPLTEDFAAMLDKSFGRRDKIEGTVVTGTVIALENDEAVVDVGLKAEGRVPLKEFSNYGNPVEVQIGDQVEVYVERFENRNGEALLSRDKARREESWNKLERAFNETEKVEGAIFGRVKGGFAVDLGGAVAFLPGSQVDIRPMRDVSPLLNKQEPFQILKMDRRRGNIVVSRRAVLEESRAEQRNELLATLKEGQVLSGVVKNITDYGAFVDLGGLDGLLHVTDISWRRVNHPTEVLGVGQTVQVQVIRFNRETQRISLGMKQLEADPWEGVELEYPVRAKFTGRVTNITDYGAFVELEPGVEGLVHVSEMSWTKKNIHPGKIVSTSQEVEVMVLEVDPDKRRISLGLKQCLGNPWERFQDSHPAGTEVEGELKNITEFGLFIGLDDDIDGMVHLSDLDWQLPPEEAVAKYKKGDMVKAVVLDIDTDKERISLGVKHLTEDPFQGAVAGLKRGVRVTATVSEVTNSGIEVTTTDGATGFIRKAELSRDRVEQRPDRFAVGEKVDARVTNIDSINRRLTLSIKALEIADEKQAMAEYGSSDSGASLGDILGPAIMGRRDQPAEEPAAQPTEEPAEEAAPEPEAAEEAAPKPEAAEEAAAPEPEAAEEAAAPEPEAAEETAPKPEAAEEAAAPEPEAAEEVAPEPKAAAEAGSEDDVATKSADESADAPADESSAKPDETKADGGGA